MRHGPSKRRRVARPTAPVSHSGQCPDCGKYRYMDRKTAKTEARRAFPGDQPSAYQCGAYWHWGHLHPDVRRGTVLRPDRRRDEP